MSSKKNIEPEEMLPIFVQLLNKVQSRATWGSSLEGKILTFIDASFSDKEQREAVKSIVRSIIREEFYTINDCLSYIIHQFTYDLDGELIEYTPIDSIYGKIDYRSLAKDNLVPYSDYKFKK